MTKMSDQIQNQVLSVVADALEALNRRVESFEAALTQRDSDITSVVSGVQSNVSALQSSQVGIVQSLSNVAANVTGLQSSLESVSSKVADMQASDAGLVEVLDRVTVVQQAQPPAPAPPVVAPVPDPVVVVAPVPDSVVVVAPVPDPAAAQAQTQAVQAAVVAAQAQAAVVAPVPDPVVVTPVLNQKEQDLGRAFPTKNIVILPSGGGYGITDPNDTDAVILASPVSPNPGGIPPFTVASADFFNSAELVVVISR